MDKYDAIKSILIILHESNTLRNIGYEMGIYSKINLLNILLHIYSIYRQDECLKYTIIDDMVCIVKEYCLDVPEYFETRGYKKLNLSVTDIDNCCINIGSLYEDNNSYDIIKQYLEDTFK